MYLWKVDALVEDFRSGKVSQREEFKYMLLFSIITGLAVDPILYVDSSYNVYDTIGSLLFLVITITGTYYCYRINSSGDDREFIARMICIGLPVLVRVLVVIIPVSAILGILEATVLYPERIDEGSVENTPTQVAFASLFEVAYIWYLSIKIRAVSTRRAEVDRQLIEALKQS